MNQVSALAIGIDLVDVREFMRAVDLSRGSLLEFCFSNKERANAIDRPETLASHFAAKEAVSKALGVGMLRQIGWHDVELVPTKRVPKVELYGRAASLAQSQKWFSWSISLSQERNFAVALIVALINNNGGDSENDAKTSPGH